MLCASLQNCWQSIWNHRGWHLFSLKIEEEGVENDKKSAPFSLHSHVTLLHSFFPKSLIHFKQGGERVKDKTFCATLLFWAKMVRFIHACNMRIITIKCRMGVVPYVLKSWFMLILQIPNHVQDTMKCYFKSCIIFLIFLFSLKWTFPSMNLYAEGICHLQINMS